jgi:hypothetical protein
MDDAPDDADDPWVIPLHGAAVPLPPPVLPPSQPTPPTASEPAEPLPGGDEVPSDVGFHPRLRRSA